MKNPVSHISIFAKIFETLLHVPLYRHTMQALVNTFPKRLTVSLIASSSANCNTSVFPTEYASYLGPIYSIGIHLSMSGISNPKASNRRPVFLRDPYLVSCSLTSLLMMFQMFLISCLQMILRSIV